MNLVRRTNGAVWNPMAGRSLANHRVLDGMFSPVLDVAERDDAYLVTVELPGMNRKDIEVIVTDNLVTIRGEKKGHTEKKRGTVYRKERWEGSFRRSVRLPADADTATIEAKMRHGVLTLTIPKRPESRRRKIKVSAA